MTASNSRRCDGCRKAISSNLNEWVGILVSYDGCNGEAAYRVFRRKAVAAFEKMSKTVAFKRTLPTERRFERLGDQSGIDEGLA